MTWKAFAFQVGGALVAGLIMREIIKRDKQGG